MSQTIHDGDLMKSIDSIKNKDLYKTISDFIDYLFDFCVEIGHLEYGNSKNIEFDFDIDNSYSVVEQYEIFINKIQNFSSPITNFISFYFQIGGLSGGENALLKLYSRLYYYYHVENKIQDFFNEFIGFRNIHNYKSPQQAPTSIIIFIDEGELGFHPNWQKRYLNDLIQMLPLIFEGLQIQLIITSHSPFVVSDLPKENVIFLKRNEFIDEDDFYERGVCQVVDGVSKENTFGANIHTLLADGFFMENGLIGDFAKGKIQEVIDFLNDKNDTMTLEMADKIINRIGEPILKMQLQKKLLKNRHFLIQYHKNELKKLKNDTNSAL